MVVKALSLSEISRGEDVGRVRSKGRAWGPGHSPIRKQRGSREGNREVAASEEGEEPAERGLGSRRECPRHCVGPFQVNHLISYSHQPFEAYGRLQK